MSKILELKLLEKLTLSNLNEFKDLDKTTFEDLIDLFYINKNFEMFKLLQKELSGYSITDTLPEYRKNIKLTATKEFVDRNASKNANIEVEGSFIGEIIYSKSQHIKSDALVIVENKNLGGFDLNTIHVQIYSKLIPIIINDVEKIIFNNFK